uniref:Uncharacterized protein n=1 Tax=Cacopsylla melanoneura TaxID=428564 RepID=A0A8D8XUC2_9HEMI
MINHGKMVPGHILEAFKQCPIISFYDRKNGILITATQFPTSFFPLMAPLNFSPILFIFYLLSNLGSQVVKTHCLLTPGWWVRFPSGAKFSLKENFVPATVGFLLSCLSFSLRFLGTRDLK